MTLRGAARVGLSEIRNKAVIEGFKLVKTQKFDEYGIELVSLEHEKTGARYMHVDTEDTNNAFCVGFCTPARDDSGVTHILEHTVLCGSERYPVKDPFFKMRNRSLSTFMNAMTYPDTTMYPFATVNPTDFGNLRSVYLDAVFFPRLDIIDFLQEGHRLEKDEDGNIKIKGVVFNEMKGVYGDPSDLFFHETVSRLYGAGSCYGFAYGGDPKAITNLTHADLKNFHKEHYSPANCTIVSYGDLPLVDSLAEVNEVLTKRLERDHSEGSRKYIVVFDKEKQAANPSPKKAETTGPTNPLMDEAQTGAKISLSWALSIPESRPDLEFDLFLLTYLLSSGPNAPLYQALIETGVGSDFTTGTGLSFEFKGGCFQVGVQKVDLEKHSLEDVENIIMTCLRDTVKNGFEPGRLESVLHQVELSQTHRPANWGIKVVTGLVHGSVHDKPAEAAFECSRLVAELREKMKKNPEYLQGLLEEHIIGCERNILHLMKPDAEHSAKVSKEEDEVQTPKVIGETPPEEVVDKAEFTKKLDVVEDLSLLPTLVVERDIPVEPLPDPEIAILSHERLELFQNVLTPTNGVWYFRLLFPINHLTQDELMLLPLLCSLVGSTGAGGYDYRELSQEIELCCSGISSQVIVGTDRKNADVSNARLVVTSYGLDRCWERFFEILSMVMTDARLSADDEAVRLRVQNVISMKATDAVNGIVGNAHVYALRHAAGQVDKHALCAEMVGGLTQVAYEKELLTTPLDTTLASLRALYDKVFACYPTVRASLTTTTPLTNDQLAAFNTFLDTLPEPSQTVPTNLVAAETPRDLSPTGKVFVPSPADLGYIGMARKTDLSFLHEDMAALEVMLRVVDSKFLHKEVREKGGAYGSGAVSSASGNDSIIGMYSYRDPATSTTAETFARCLEWLEKEENLKDIDVNEAKLQVFSGADAPKSPQFLGLREFLSTVTMEDVKTKRLRLLGVTKEDILRVGRKYLKPEWTEVKKAAGSEFFETAAVVVGGENAWTELKKKDDKWGKWSKLDTTCNSA
eukprot:TRINITY_DN28788_c0_g1_i1.p1 TRINITY_DN28788_c0_g1~~TRINITY_DN28788_c0_g1_i1.p1  ORF type:complete len:1027 (+),score=349.21 TRINITY_DN28788_c0_g1_i1:13-3093(+)